MRRPRPQIRSKFANIPGITSLPRDPPPTIVPRPPRRQDAEDPSVQVDGTRLHGLETRVAVAEKSTRALLVEVVRLQNDLSTAMKTVDEEKAARRDAENRMRATADTMTQVGARLQREEQKRRTDDETAKTLIATAQDAEAAALAARQEAVKRVEEQATRYQFSVRVDRLHALADLWGRMAPFDMLKLHNYGFNFDQRNIVTY